MTTVLQILLTLFVSFVSLFIGVFYGEKIGPVFGIKICNKFDLPSQQNQNLNLPQEIAAVQEQSTQAQTANLANQEQNQIGSQQQPQIPTAPQQQNQGTINTNSQEQLQTVQQNPGSSIPDVKIKINQVEQKPENVVVGMPSSNNQQNTEQQKNHPISINVDINQNAGIQQQKPYIDQQPNNSVQQQQNSPKLKFPQLKK